MKTMKAILQLEESKREKASNSLSRWKNIQEMIAWGEQQSTCRRNTKEKCLEKQAMLLNKARSR